MMKTIIKTKNTVMVFISMGILLFSGCDNWSEDINVDTSRPIFDENIDPNLFLLPTMDYLFSRTGGGFSENSWDVMMPTVQYNAKTRSLSQPHRHRSWHDFGGNVWQTGYSVLNGIKNVRRAALATNDTRYEAVADIWESYIMYIITLMYGDIPYFAAVGDELVTQVEYDSQADIFPALMDKLKNASDLIGNQTDPINSNTDVIFLGDIQKWRKFANVLRFKAAMHFHNSDPVLTESIMKEIVDNPSKYPMFESNNDNANFHFDGSQRISPWYLNSIANEDNLPMSNVFVERLLSIADPRIYQFAKPVQKVHSDPNMYVLPTNKGVDKYLGHLSGITTSNGDAATWNGGVEYCSRQTSDWFRPVDENFVPLDGAKTTPWYISHYPEVTLLKAEAALKGWISSDPKALYEEGIRASLEMFQATFTDARYDRAYAEDALNDINEYLAQQQVSWTGGRDQMLLISEQRWIACYQLIIEPYFDHRRTMLPPIVSSNNATAFEATGSGTRFPARADYPESERQKNTEGVTKALSEGFDIEITGEENRTEARMYIINNPLSPSLQMPIFQEPFNGNGEYPGGNNFKTWFDQHWKTMLWWEN
ncbi:SusD/RagB family nutrient-binding outer membrane lipoprotein [Aestuariivivens sp. NBU2969]|uniref:SusD/RagB family nutrient-binding outer membrane lipoprotein n=1 Tax=Aestuariivivens sp. NBU2969 TaxID=2873267 RepID=UPI001CBB43A2|nr:SusD/RagB family nutrient-binding outer membrane lipoprotein [Aestuariivivens sp. NBU2969]